MGGYYGYMTLQAKRLNNTLLDKQTLVQQEQLKLNTLKKNVSYDDKISLRWEVESMQKIYASWGLIDQFVEMEFIENITIPFYRRSGNLYEFILDATIKTYDTVGGQI